MSRHLRKKLIDSVLVDTAQTVVYKLASSTYMVFNLIIQSTHDPISKYSAVDIATSNALQLIKLGMVCFFRAVDRHAVVVHSKDYGEQVASGNLTNNKEHDDVFERANPSNSAIGEKYPMDNQKDALTPGQEL